MTTPELPPLPTGPIHLDELIRYLLQFAGLATAWVAKHVWARLEKTQERIEGVDRKADGLERKVEDLTNRLKDLQSELDEHHDECDERHDSTERKLRNVTEK